MAIPSDPMERLVFDALLMSGIDFIYGPENNLDFYIPSKDVYIEVKQMHSNRISEQMSRAPNVIAVQGVKSVWMLCTMLENMK